jgi:hypothetical protein
MNTKDWSRMVDSDTAPRVPEEFVRYDENGTVPGSLSAAENTQVGYVITATTQDTVDDLTVPHLSAADIANIANAIKEGKNVSIYDATANVYFVPMTGNQSETESSVVIVMFHPFVIIEYLAEGKFYDVKVYKLNMNTV